MKRIFSAFTLIFLCSVLLTAQSPEEIKTIRKNTAHWSIGIKGGTDYFRVVPRATASTLPKYYFRQTSYGCGLFVEYSANPYYGIGIEASFFNYDRPIIDVASGEELMHYGNTIDAIVMSSVNLSNVLGPYRTEAWRKITFFLNIGLGTAAYSYKTPDIEEYSKRRWSALGSGGIAIEFNLGKSWTLLIDGNYRYYARRNLGGLDHGPEYKSTDALTSNLGVRWKINAQNKNHVRNMIPSEYYPTPVERIIIEKTVEVNDEPIQQEVSEFEQEFKKRLNKLENDYLKLLVENNELQEKIENMTKDTPDDLEMELDKLNQEDVTTIVYNNIDFEFNSYTLTASTKEVLNEIIATLKTNPSWKKINITGHTDDVGSYEANKKISEKRAESVRNYFVANGIAANKLTAVGYGYDKPIASNSTHEGRAQNRRVEFEISK